MPAVRVECGKGCGGWIEMDAPTVDNMLALGQPLTAEHAECDAPAVEVGPERPLRTFARLLLVMTEVGPEWNDDLLGAAEAAHRDRLPGDLLAMRACTARAPGFGEAVNGGFTNWLNQQWPQLQGYAATADLPAR